MRGGDRREKGGGFGTMAAALERAGLARPLRRREELKLDELEAIEEAVRQGRGAKGARAVARSVLEARERAKARGR